MKNTSPCAKKQDTMYRCEVGSQWEGSGSTHEEFIFFLLGWGGVGLDRKREFFFVHCSQCVLIMFSWGFQNVPQDVPNFTSDLSLMVCPKFNNHVNKVKRWAIGEHYCFYFATKEVLLFGSAQMFQIFLMMGQLIWLLKKKKKLRAHPWIN